MEIGGLELQDNCLGGEVGFIHKAQRQRATAVAPPGWRTVHEATGRACQTPALGGGLLPYGSLDVWQRGGRLGTVSRR